MPAWALQLVLFVGRIVLRTAMDKQLRHAITSAILSAEQQGGDGQQKMGKVLEQVKASGIQAVKHATEPELRSVIEMLLPKVVGKVGNE